MSTETETKVCAICKQALPIDRFYFHRKSNYRFARCQSCINEIQRNTRMSSASRRKADAARCLEWRRAHPDVAKARLESWLRYLDSKRAECGDKWRDSSNRWSLLNPEKRKQTIKACMRKRTDELADGYVASCLRISVSKAPKALVETKREQLKLKRLCRELTTSTN